MLRLVKQCTEHSGIGCSDCFFLIVGLFIQLPPDLWRFTLLSSASSGIGAGMDIVVSSVKAYVGALNKMLGFQNQLPSNVYEEQIPVSF